MARLTLTQFMAPAGVGLLSGAVNIGVQNAQKNLDERIAGGEAAADEELNAFVRNLPDILDISLGVAAPVLYGMDILTERWGGRDISAAGITVGTRSVVGMIGRAILGLNPGEGERRSVPYTLEPRVEERSPAPTYGGPTSVWEHPGW